MDIGFIGLGKMGMPMAHHLLDSDYTLHIYNRTQSKCVEFVKKGALSMSTPALLASSVDVVILMVTDDDAVKSIIFGENGIVNDKNFNCKVIIDHSTISPDCSLSMHQQLKEIGISYLDAPVSGAPVGARKAELTTYVGGEKETFELVKDIISQYSDKIHYMGDAGKGQATKVCNQVMVLNTMLSACEALKLAKLQGLDIHKLLSAFRGNLFDSKIWRIYTESTFL
ncbi:NAD(P)-dependent oxidoreductase [Piscirickettsia litoralis]|uniref:6-phosphogluconate dehydrogenase n=1 Tax=Piscirickettsia litoralis TaxID=1891921 RepID=A0ABX2ZYZ3_9GAMM|nr:NAD(P)-dependent oxidoreductase [Piscirickettsia litoralis]ODN41448.1 hypothetical protein BGC07_15095 [Piscirickettsia litoralis]